MSGILPQFPARAARVVSAAAQVPEKDGGYPEAFIFNRRPLPAYGFYVRHADRVKFENVTVTSRSPDARKQFVFDDCGD